MTVTGLLVTLRERKKKKEKVTLKRTDLRKGYEFFVAEEEKDKRKEEKKYNVRLSASRWVISS